MKNNPTDPTVEITQDEKTFIKESIIEQLQIEDDPVIIKMLAEVVNIVAVNEFPQSWPTLLPKLIAGIREGGAAGNILKVRGV